jgi:hypothetical protein
MYIIQHAVAKCGGKHVKDRDSFIGSWWGEAKREVRGEPIVFAGVL